MARVKGQVTTCAAPATHPSPLLSITGTRPVRMVSRILQKQPASSGERFRKQYVGPLLVSENDNTNPGAASRHEPGAGRALPRELTAFVARQFVLQKLLLVREPTESLGLCWTEWREWCAGRKVLWRARITLVSRRVHRQAKMTWDVWTREVELGKEGIFRAEMIVLFAAKQFMTRAIRKWVAWQDEVDRRVNNNVFAIHARARALVRGITREWLGASQRRMVMESMMSNLYAGVCLTLTKTALSAWRYEWCGISRRMGTFATEAASRRCRSLLRVALVQLAETAIWRAIKRVRSEQSAKLASRHHARMGREAIACWHNVVYTQAELVDKTREALAMTLRRALFARLCDTFSRADEQRTKQSLIKADCHRETTIIRRALWDFVIACRSIRHIRRIESTSVRFRDSKYLSYAFGTWARRYRDSVREEEVSRSAEIHRNTVLLRSFHCEWRLCARTQSGKWWVRNAAITQGEARICVRAFRALFEAAQHRRDMVALLRCAAGHDYLSRIGRAFKWWGGSCPESFLTIKRQKRREHRCLAAMHAVHLFRKALVCGREFVRMQSNGFWGWVLGLSEQLHCQETRAQAIAHYAATASRRTFSQMLKYSKARTHKSTLAMVRHTQIRTVLNHSKALRCWSVWREVHARLTLKRMRKAMAKGHRGFSLTSAALCEWAVALVWKRHVTTVVYAVTSRVRARIWRTVLLQWVEESERLRGKRALERAVKAVWKKMAVKDHWEGFVVYAQWRRGKRDREAQALSERRVYVLKQAAVKWLKTGTDLIAKRQTGALEAHSRANARLYARVARYARHWMAVTFSRKAQRMRDAREGGGGWGGPVMSANYSHQLSETLYPNKWSWSKTAASGFPAPTLQKRTTHAQIPAQHPEHSCAFVSIDRLSGHLTGHVAKASRPAPRRSPILLHDMLLGTASGGKVGAFGYAGATQLDSDVYRKAAEGCAGDQGIVQNAHRPEKRGTPRRDAPTSVVTHHQLPNNNFPANALSHVAHGGELADQKFAHLSVLQQLDLPKNSLCSLPTSTPEQVQSSKSAEQSFAHLSVLQQLHPPTANSLTSNPTHSASPGDDSFVHLSVLSAMTTFHESPAANAHSHTPPDTAIRSIELGHTKCSPQSFVPDSPFPPLERPAAWSPDMRPVDSRPAARPSVNSRPQVSPVAHTRPMKDRRLEMAPVTDARSEVNLVTECGNHSEGARLALDGGASQCPADGPSVVLHEVQGAAGGDDDLCLIEDDELDIMEKFIMDFSVQKAAHGERLKELAGLEKAMTAGIHDQIVERRIRELKNLENEYQSYRDRNMPTILDYAEKIAVLRADSASR